MKPLPSIVIAYGLLLNDEKQIQVFTISFLYFFFGSTSFDTGVVRNNSYFLSRVNFEFTPTKTSLIVSIARNQVITLINAINYVVSHLILRSLSLWVLRKMLHMLKLQSLSLQNLPLVPLILGSLG